jgi:hypothetical protein
MRSGRQSSAICLTQVRTFRFEVGAVSIVFVILCVNYAKLSPNKLPEAWRFEQTKFAFMREANTAKKKKGWNDFLIPALSQLPRRVDLPRQLASLETRQSKGAGVKSGSRG